MLASIVGRAAAIDRLRRPDFATSACAEVLAKSTWHRECKGNAPMRILPLSIAAALLVACGGDPSTLGSGGANGSGGGSSSSQDNGSGEDSGGPVASSDGQYCVDQLNVYRAKVGAAPFTRSDALQTFATDGAKSDSQSNQPHGHFIATNGGGIAFAENEVPGWPQARFGSVRAVIDGGLKMMFGEGPGGGHYENMTNKSYTQGGCGVYVTSQSEVWVTMDFR
jgi:hypothetical protein